MAKYWEDNLFPQFLSTIDSCTLSEFTSYEIQSQLGDLAIKSIADFKFPQYSLDYVFDETINTDVTDIKKGYYFTNDNVGQREFNVILARMKAYWIEYQISQERLFANAYYDKEIRLHSPGNTIDKLIKMYTTFKYAADKAEYDYGRVSTAGDAAIGAINDDVT